MYLICLDLEGILIPEIWQKIAQVFKIEELKLTTRDIPNFDLLMRRRLKILNKKRIKIQKLQKIIKKIKPFKGAIKFLNRLRQDFPVIILSDSFYEFVNPLVKKLCFPTIFCNSLVVDKKGFLKNYQRKKTKEEWVSFFKNNAFKVIAIGDSFNDLEMLKRADFGILFSPPKEIIKNFPKIPLAKNYSDCLSKIKMIL